MEDDSSHTMANALLLYNIFISFHKLSIIKNSVFNVDDIQELCCNARPVARRKECYNQIEKWTICIMRIGGEN
jgi:hypothetical protein